MATENASRDQNNVPTLIASSSADGKTPLRVWADPTTHRLLVNATGITPTSPGGSDTDVQYNQAGSFGGDGNFTWNYTSQNLTIEGTITNNIPNFESTVFNFEGGNSSFIIQGDTSAALHLINTANGDGGQFLINNIVLGDGIMGIYSDATGQSILSLDLNNNLVGILTNSPQFALDVNGSANVPGSSGSTYRWNTNASAPSTTVGAVSTSHYGSGTTYLGTPNQWVLVDVGGTDYKIPLYS